MKLLTLVASCVALTLGGCVISSGYTPYTKDMQLPQGPPIADVVTPFDEALICLSGKINKNYAFAVGSVLDLTGKEQFTEGGAGKFVTQGAGDIVQSALFKAGLTVINRRDPRIMETEAKWGLRKMGESIPSNFFVTGSINSLDFIPGGAVEAQIAGVGPRFRQNRILVGLDLAITDSTSGRVVSNVSLQKQIYTSEAGFGIGRFFGDDLVILDISGKEREAVQLALRHMLNLATFDLLTQIMKPENVASCRQILDPLQGTTTFTPAALAAAKFKKIQLENEVLQKEVPQAIEINGEYKETKPSESSVVIKPLVSESDENTSNSEMFNEMDSVVEDDIKMKTIITQ